MFTGIRGIESPPRLSACGYILDIGASLEPFGIVQGG